MVKILIGGDFAPTLRTKELVNNGDFDFLSEIKMQSAQSDITIINLECPIVSDTDKPISKVGPNLDCPPQTIEALTYAGIDIVTLANNHSLDYGSSALMRTIELCNNANIKAVGAGQNLSDAEQILYVNKNQTRISIISCCEHEYSIATDKTAGANPLNPIKQYYKIQEARKNSDYVIVIVHGGHERFQLPSIRMQETYRFFIDAGADVVVNHHQHCFSGYEEYKSKLIFYGLGNLSFDTKNHEAESWYQGYMVRLNLDNRTRFEILPYTQCTPDSVNTHFLPTGTYDNKLNALNEIIASPKLLHDKLYSYYEQENEYIQSVFDFYSNKWLKALRRRKYIPSMLSHEKMKHIHNFLFCESHFDKVKHFFNIQ